MKVCWGFTGSFCTLAQVFPALEILKSKHEIIPVCSNAVCSISTRFGEASEITKKIEAICGRKIISTLDEAEPIGPSVKPDITVIAPLTGNSLAKLANGIYDTPVTLAAKAHLRNNRPLLLALASNDGLSFNFRNLADIYTQKNVFLVPMRQDDPIKKPASLVADASLLLECIDAAMNRRQLLPLFR